jgi:hypothetical protein
MKIILGEQSLYISIGVNKINLCTFEIQMKNNARQLLAERTSGSVNRETTLSSLAEL